MTCAYCGAIESEVSPVHRDAADLGPLLSLCTSCAQLDPEDIRAKATTLVRCTNKIATNVVLMHAPQFVVEARIPLWVVVVAEAWTSVLWTGMCDSFVALLEVAKDNADLQDTIISAQRMGCSAFEIIAIVQEAGA